jgi:hypothetical protein
MDQVHEFDPQLVDVLFATRQLSGFSEDTLITYEEDEDKFVDVQGVDGDVTRSKRAGTKGTLTIALMSSSASNDFLSGIHNLDRLEDGGAGVSPLLIRDRNGTTLLATDTSWIIKPAPMTLGRQAQAREWQIRVVGGALNVGGNSTV